MALGINVTGDGTNEKLTGTADDDTLNGAGGNDTLLGLDGNDSLVGGTEADRILGGDGADTLVGGDGDDFLRGDAGADDLDGGDGDDRISIDQDDVDSGSINGGTGIDRLLAAGAIVDLDLQGTNAEWFAGSTGDDSVFMTGSDSVTLVGGAGNDTLAGGSGNDRMQGGSGDDSMLGGVGNDTMSGNGGTDTLDGGAGFDMILATGNTGVTFTMVGFGAVGSPDLQGDTFLNFEGVIGTNFNDTLIGDGNVNSLVGGAGFDTLTGNGGADSLYGGDGNDDITIDQDDVVAGEIKAGSGFDLIRAASAVGTSTSFFDLVDAEAERFSGSNGDDYVTAAGATYAVNIATAGGNDHLVGGDVGTDSLNGGSGDDTLDGGAGDDQLRGGTGADVLIGGAGDDNLRGQGDVDVFQFNATDIGNDTIGGYELGEDLVFDGDLALNGGLFMFGSSGSSTIITHVGLTGSIRLNGVDQALVTESVTTAVDGTVTIEFL